MQHAFKAALDTPLQSAIYTIQQLLHEQGALPPPAPLFSAAKPRERFAPFFVFEAVN